MALPSVFHLTPLPPENAFPPIQVRWHGRGAKVPGKVTSHRVSTSPHRMHRFAHPYPLAATRVPLPDCSERPDIATAYLKLVSAYLETLPHALTASDLVPLLQLICSVPRATHHPAAVRTALETLRDFVKRAAAQAPTTGALGALVSAGVGEGATAASPPPPLLPGSPGAGVPSPPPSPPPAEGGPPAPPIFYPALMQVGQHLVAQLFNFLLPERPLPPSVTSPGRHSASPGCTRTAPLDLGGIQVGQIPHLADLLLALYQHLPNEAARWSQAAMEALPVPPTMASEARRFLSAIGRERRTLPFRAAVTMFGQMLRQALAEQQQQRLQQQRQ